MLKTDAIQLFKQTRSLLLESDEVVLRRVSLGSGLQQLHRYYGAGLCIRKGVMVVHEIISTGCGDGLELMVREPATEVAAGSREMLK